MSNVIVVAANENTAQTVSNPQALQANTSAGVATVAVAGTGGFSASPTVGELIEFQLTGLLVVFVVLGGLTLLCYLIARTLKIVAPNQYYVRPRSPK